MNRNHIAAKKAKIFDGKKRMPCIYCRKLLGYKEATIEHLLPLKSGGNNSVSNFGIACRECNR